MKSYAVWEIQTTNMVGDFDNERHALALVLDIIKHSGPEIADALAFNVEDEAGEIHFIAQGQELAERARREFANHPAVR